MNSRSKRRGSLGPLEAEVMKAVWHADVPVSVRAIVSTLNAERTEPCAYTTVMTVMTRLADKGMLSRRKEGRGYLYEATASDAAGLAVKDVMRTYGEAAVAHFVDEARTDPAIMRRLQGLLDEPGE